MSRSRPQSKYSILNNLHIMYDFIYDPIVSYLNNTENMILKLNLNLDKRFKKMENQINSRKDLPFDYPEAFDIFEEEIIHLSKFNELLRNSIFITIYSNFEIELLRICELSKHIDIIDSNPKKIKANGYISKFKKFLEIEIQVDLSKTDKLWSKIQIFKEMRNAITHELGTIENPSIELLSYVNSMSGVKLKKPQNQIEFSDNSVLLDFISTAKSFLSQVIDEIVNQK